MHIDGVILKAQAVQFKDCLAGMRHFKIMIGGFAGGRFDMGCASLT
jgi:hypothetical protein